MIHNRYDSREHNRTHVISRTLDQSEAIRNSHGIPLDESAPQSLFQMILGKGAHMAGLKQTGRILVTIMIPWIAVGCAANRSQVAQTRPHSIQEMEQSWSRAQLMEQHGKYVEAEHLYAELARQNPKSARYAHRLGVTAAMAGDHEQSRAAYQQALRLDPKNSELMTDVGYAAYLRQDYEEAERLLRSALSLDESNLRAKSNLALVVGIQGRDDECTELFREVHGQNEAEVLSNLAYIKSQRGENDAATDLYQQALALDPQLQKARVALAGIQSSREMPTQVAGKPYRKYMNKNAPKVASVRPQAEVQTAENQASVESGDVQLTSLNNDLEASEMRSAVATANVLEQADELEIQAESSVTPPYEEEALTDWAEEKNQKLPQTATNAAPAFPDEDDSLVPLPVPSQVPETAEQTPSASTKDQPITVVQPAPTSVEFDEASENSNGTSSEVEEIFTASDGWQASSENQLTAFSTAWIERRMNQITQRRGLSGFMGFCPVALRDEQKLKDSQATYTTEYQSQTYQFSSEDAMKKFESNPTRYLPAAGGLDVVAVSQGSAVAVGSLEHALWFRHRLYLFLNHENLETFRNQARQLAVQ